MTGNQLFDASVFRLDVDLNEVDGLLAARSVALHVRGFGESRAGGP